MVTFLRTVSLLLFGAGVVALAITVGLGYVLRRDRAKLREHASDPAATLITYGTVAGALAIALGPFGFAAATWATGPTALPFTNPVYDLATWVMVVGTGLLSVSVLGYFADVLRVSVLESDPGRERRHTVLAVALVVAGLSGTVLFTTEATRALATALVGAWRPALGVASLCAAVTGALALRRLG